MLYSNDSILDKRTGVGRTGFDVMVAALCCLNPAGPFELRVKEGGYTIGDIRIFR
jgi:hypothetical protein